MCVYLYCKYCSYYICTYRCFLYFVHTYSFSYIFFYSILNLLAFSHFFFHRHSVTLTVWCIDLVLISSPDWYALSNGIMLWSLFFLEQIVLCFMYCNYKTTWSEYVYWRIELGHWYFFSLFFRQLMHALIFF